MAEDAGAGGGEVCGSGGPPGWYRDPFGRHGERRWDGAAWTERVRDGDLAGIDPPGIDVAPRGASPEVPVETIEPGTGPVRWKSTRLPAMIAVSLLVLAAIVGLIVVVAVTG